MTLQPAGGGRRRWTWLSYRRQQTLSLLIVAAVPVLVLSALGYTEIRRAVGSVADAQAQNAARAVRVILSRDGARLDASVRSYATWPTLQQEIARLDFAAVRQDVLDFQVAHGDVDAAVLIDGSQAAAGGSADATGTLLADLSSMLRNAGPGADLGPTFVASPDGVYQVAASAIALGDLTGPGVMPPSDGPVGIAFARRLDSAFVLDVKQETGFDVAVYTAGGQVTAASNLSLAPHLDPAMVAGTTPPLPPGTGAVGALVPLTGPAGTPVGAIELATTLQVIDVLGSTLLPLLAALLVLTLAGALIGAVLLSLRLRRRLAEVAGGIAAVAEGNLSVRLPEGDHDDLERLAGSHNRLAAALARRETSVRDALASLQLLRADVGVERLAQEAVTAACSIFGLAICWLRSEDGAIIAQEPAGGHPPSPDLSQRAGSEPAPVWLEASLPPAAKWTDADEALFVLFARELGAALREAAAYERAEQRVDRLTRVNALQRDFLRGVSHNLQSPVTAIIATADDLRDRLPAGTADRAEVDLIHGRAVRLAHTVGQLLTVARLDAGVYQPETDLIAPALLARRAWAAQASDRPFAIDDRSAGALALGDQAGIEQVLWILLDNALKYAPEGEVRVEIVRDGNELEVRVLDEGPGVPAGERDRIFVRFQRGSTSQGRDGTGLGLSVARGMLEAMGGRIWHEERPGGGAVFAFALAADVATEPV